MNETSRTSDIEPVDASEAFQGKTMKAASPEAAIGQVVGIDHEQGMAEGVPEEVADPNARLCYQLIGRVKDVRLVQEREGQSIFEIRDAEVLGIEGRFFDR